MIRKTITAACLIFLLSSCSAAILSVGKEEYSILYYGVSQNKVSGFLGEPVESTNLKHSLTFPEIMKQFDYVEFLGYPLIDKKAKETPVKKLKHTNMMAEYKENMTLVKLYTWLGIPFS